LRFAQNDKNINKFFSNFELLTAFRNEFIQ